MDRSERLYYTTIADGSKKRQPGIALSLLQEALRGPQAIGRVMARSSYALTPLALRRPMNVWGSRHASGP